MKKQLNLKGLMLFLLVFFTSNPAILYAQNTLDTFSSNSSIQNSPKEIIKEYYDTGELRYEMDKDSKVTKFYNKNGTLLKKVKPNSEVVYSYFLDTTILKRKIIHSDKSHPMGGNWETIDYYRNGKISRIAGDDGVKEYDENGNLGRYNKYKWLLFLYILLLLLFFFHVIKNLVVIYSEDENIKMSYRSVFVNASIVIQCFLFYMMCQGIIAEELRGSWSRIASGVVALLVLPFLSIVNIILSLYMCKTKNLRSQALLYIGISGIMINPITTMGMAELVCEYLGY